MSLPDAVVVILAALSEATDQVQVWGDAVQVDTGWGEVNAEFYAMLREDDPEVASNPRLRIQMHLDLLTAYVIQRADAGEGEDPLPDDAPLAEIEMELRLPPTQRLWSREEMAQLAQAISDWPAIPGCQIDYENDELPYGHTLTYERTLTKGEFFEEFEWRAEEPVERQYLLPLFSLMARALTQAKMRLLGEW